MKTTRLKRGIEDKYWDPRDIRKKLWKEIVVPRKLFLL